MPDWLSGVNECFFILSDTLTSPGPKAEAMVSRWNHIHVALIGRLMAVNMRYRYLMSPYVMRPWAVRAVIAAIFLIKKEKKK